MSTGDPRIYFAAERTFLAWVRTGVALMGLGFVVARFGLIMRLLALAPAAGSSSTGFSGYIGSAFVLLGAASVALASVQFSAFQRTLSAAEKPRPAYTSTLSLALAFTTSGLGFTLAVFLLL